MKSDDVLSGNLTCSNQDVIIGLDAVLSARHYMRLKRPEIKETARKVVISSYVD
jgi:hypothetical protein